MYQYKVGYCVDHVIPKSMYTIRWSYIFHIDLMYCVLSFGCFALDKTAVLFDAEEKYIICQLVQVLSNFATYNKVRVRKNL